MRWLAGLVALLLAAPAVAAPRLDAYPQVTSQFVKARDVQVWVPDACQVQACGVLYMQDGQNLFDDAKAYGGISWSVPKVLSGLIDAKKVPPVIVVGISNTDLRGREYLPQKVYDRMPAAARARIAKNWGGEPLSDQYLKFVVTELKPFIDKTYHTKADAADTFIAGSSMGGLISLYAQAEYPEAFGGSASLSMHWPLDNPWVNTPDDTVNAPEVIAAFDAYMAGSALKPEGHRIYIDHGTDTLDAHYRPYSLGFEAKMRARGWQDGKSFSSQIFPGEAHSEGAWSKRLDSPLKFLLAGKVVASGSLIRHRQVTSAFVKARDVQVWLPNGYDPAKSYPVIYMMDGQNLFDPSYYAGVDWGVAETLPRLIEAGKVPPAIVVGIDNIDERTREYMPERVYKILPPDYRARVRAFENGQPPNSDAFLKFLVTELKPYIDKTYATKSGPESTSIMGSSSGGHIALYAQGEYPQVFGASASLSMPWLMASPARDAVHIRADAAILRAAWGMWLTTSKMKPGPNRIYTDQGTIELDALFTPYEEAIVPLFPAAGWTEGKDFAAPIFDGARHSETDWRKRLDVPMVFVLTR